MIYAGTTQQPQLKLSHHIFKQGCDKRCMSMPHTLQRQTPHVSLNNTRETAACRYVTLKHKSNTTDIQLESAGFFLNGCLHLPPTQHNKATLSQPTLCQRWLVMRGKDAVMTCVSHLLMTNIWWLLSQSEHPFLWPSEGGKAMYASSTTMHT